MKLHGLLLILLVCSGLLRSADELERLFLHPPREARPQIWYHWVDNQVTREGITRDLEAIKQAGLGGVTLFDVSAFKLSGTPKTLSPEWFALIQHAIREADRLDLEFGLQNTPGWSSGGGPWIKPEQSMKELQATETVVTGGRTLSLKLPRVSGAGNYYEDVALLAFPSLPGESLTDRNHPTITTEVLPAKAKFPGVPLVNDPAELLKAGNRRVLILDPAATGQPQSLTLVYPKTFTAGSAALRFTAPPWNSAARLQLSISDDGKNYRPYCTSPELLTSGEIFTFPPVTSRFLRLTIVETRDNRPLLICGVSLSARVPIPGIAQKAFYKGGTVPGPAVHAVPASHIIRRDSIIDLSDRMNRDGQLSWDAPPGTWTLLRFGAVARYNGNHPATREGRGLECDKMSSEGIDAVWQGMMAKIVRQAGPLAGKTLKYTMLDSYENGPQNWTNRMPEHFRRLRGYDLVVHLPILTGRYLESPEYSERFLEDFRRTVSDLFAEFYGRYYAEVVNRNGLRFVTEPYGSPFDSLLQGRYADIPMGEFWASFKSAGNVRLAADIAQLKNTAIVQSESFSSSSNTGAWRGTPAGHKVQSDQVFCHGVTRLVLHSFVHQPYESDGAGMTMGYWGGHFNRKNTLWPFFHGWFAYLARVQALLQQGTTPAEVLYVGTEDTPSKPEFTPALPFGYQAHCCDTRLLEEAVVKDGRILLPGGQSYTLLIIPKTRIVSLTLLRKLHKLAADGGTLLLGERPLRPFGLRDYPAADRELTQLADALWGGNGSSRKIGAGTVYRGISPRPLLPPPSFALTATPEAGREINFIHRKLPDREIFFLANLSENREPFHFRAQFRADGQPEFWDAQDGSIRPVPVWKTIKGMIEIPITLQYGHSLFVIFRKNAAPAAHYQDLQCRFSTTAPTALQIQKSVWRAVNRSAECDVTALLRQQIIDGTLHVRATAQNLGGDCAPGRVKELAVEALVDGSATKVTIPEWQTLTLRSQSHLRSAAPPVWRLHEENGRFFFYSEKAASLTLTGADGKNTVVTIPAGPEPQDLSSDWELRFLSGRGAPERLKLPRLSSLSLHKNPEVRHYAGTTLYRHTFEHTPDASGPNRRVWLDLGVVCDIAEVRLNGQSVATLWQSPFRADVTVFLQPGANTLEIQVANRWINRLIGDEEHPVEGTWENTRHGQLVKELPDWVRNGGKSPVGRTGFTSYRYWKKGDPLVNSGLLGPVTLHTELITELPAP